MGFLFLFLSSVILKEQFMLAVAFFRVSFAPATLLLTQCLLFVWSVRGC